MLHYPSVLGVAKAHDKWSSTELEPHASADTVAFFTVAAQLVVFLF